MHSSARGVAGTVALLLVALVLSGCRLTGSESRAAVGSRPVRVVAAENFYGSLARQIGGRRVQVTSVLSNPDADPHLFEADSRVQLAVARADVVIANGAGYDDWMSRLLGATATGHRRTLTVATVIHVAGPDPNPHLWYDVPKLPTLVRAIGAQLSAVDPAHADTYRAGVQRTVAGLRPLVAAVRGLRHIAPGAPVAYTERVPGLLLRAAGLRVLTPPTFARSVEDGTDPTPRDVATMQTLLVRHRVKALLYNQQAATAVTDELRRIAQAHGVPVVPVTETQPAHTSFVDWQLRQVRALTAAVES